MTDPRYAAARAKALASQAKARPADPQANWLVLGPRPDPRVTVAELARSCRCRHRQIVHHLTGGGRRTYCTIATSTGRCRCDLYRPEEQP